MGQVKAYPVQPDISEQTDQGSGNKYLGWNSYEHTLSPASGCHEHNGIDTNTKRNSQTSEILSIINKGQ